MSTAESGASPGARRRLVVLVQGGRVALCRGAHALRGPALQGPAGRSPAAVAVLEKPYEFVCRQIEGPAFRTGPEALTSSF